MFVISVYDPQKYYAGSAAPASATYSGPDFKGHFYWRNYTPGLSKTFVWTPNSTDSVIFIAHEHYNDASLAVSARPLQISGVAINRIAYRQTTNFDTFGLYWYHNNDGDVKRVQFLESGANNFINDTQFLEIANVNVSSLQAITTAEWSVSSLGDNPAIETTLSVLRDQAAILGFYFANVTGISAKSTNTISLLSGYSNIAISELATAISPYTIGYDAVTVNTAYCNAGIVVYAGDGTAKDILAISASPTSALSSGTGNAWSTPSNVFTLNNIKSSQTLFKNIPQQTLQTRNFGFSIPVSATIFGIQVFVVRNRSGGTTGQARDNVVRLVKGGAAVGDNKAVTGANWAFGNRTITYGRRNDLWGTTWTPAEINADNFGLDFRAVGNTSTTNRIANVDAIYIRIFYTE